MENPPPVTATSPPPCPSPAAMSAGIGSCGCSQGSQLPYQTCAGAFCGIGSTEAVSTCTVT